MTATRAVAARLRVVVAVAFLAGLFSTLPAQADPAGPAREGTIVGGLGSFGVRDCRSVPDCSTWLQSDCAPVASPSGTGLFTSIVDVADLAGSAKRRTFTYSGVWQAATIQFWGPECSQVGPTYRTLDERLAGLRIPRGARWMTVVASNGFTCRWKLT